MIKQAKDIQNVGVEVFVRQRWRGKQPKEIDGSVKAEINNGRWIVKCPYCSGAEAAEKTDPRFFCLSCGNAQNGGKWLRVIFPANADKIEAILEKRDNAQNKNWKNETLRALESEAE